MKDNHLGPFVLFPLIFGIMFARHTFSAQLKGLAAFGNILQLYGVAMFFMFGIYFIYLLKQNEKQTG